MGRRCGLRQPADHRLELLIVIAVNAGELHAHVLLAAPTYHPRGPHPHSKGQQHQAHRCVHLEHDRRLDIAAAETYIVELAPDGHRNTRAPTSDGAVAIEAHYGTAFGPGRLL